MIDETTSLTLNNAFKSPGIAAHKAPAIIPHITIKGINIGDGKSTKIPIAVTVNPPANICPGVPMLNNPVLFAKATDNPVKIKGVAVAIELPIL